MPGGKGRSSAAELAVTERRSPCRGWPPLLMAALPPNRNRWRCRGWRAILAVPFDILTRQHRIRKTTPRARTNLLPANNKAHVNSLRLWFPDRGYTANFNHSVLPAGLLDGYSAQGAVTPPGWCGGSLESRQWRRRRKRREQGRVRAVAPRTLRSWKSGTTRLLTPCCDYAEFSPLFCRLRARTLRMETKEKVGMASRERTMAA